MGQFRLFHVANRRIHAMRACAGGVAMSLLLGTPDLSAECPVWRLADANAGLDGAVYALAVYDDGSGPLLHAGGSFLYSSTTPVFNIARWESDHWAPLGDGVAGPVYALSVYQGALVVGGSFTIAGADQARYLARWDGHQWSELGGGANNDVVALTVFNDRLVVGGRFSRVGPVSANHIARWDGSDWSTLGAGLDYQGVFALSGYNFALIAGGDFYWAGDLSVKRIARHYLYQWFPLGEGLNDKVHALAVHGADLIVGGAFTASGTLPLARVARWDGQAWSAMGDGFNDVVRALTVYNGELIAAGSFTASGQREIPFVARWNNGQWLPLGGAVTRPVNALTVHRRDLVVGGEPGGAEDKGCGQWSCIVPTAPRLIGAASRRWHAAAGRFDLPLSLNPPPTIEPRRTESLMHIVVVFDQAVEAADGRLDCGQEAVITNGDCQQVEAIGNEVVTILSADRAACLSLRLSGLRGAGAGPELCDASDVSLILHEADVNQNGMTNLLDLQMIKNGLNQPVTGDTFRLDINCDGRINVLDLQSAKNNLNLPTTCP